MIKQQPSLFVAYKKSTYIFFLQIIVKKVISIQYILNQHYHFLKELYPIIEHDKALLHVILMRSSC